MEREVSLCLGIAGGSFVEEEFVLKHKCPLTEQWIKNKWYWIYDGILLGHKKEQNLAIGSTRMQLELIMLR